MKGLKDLSNEDRLWELGLFSLEEIQQIGDCLSTGRCHKMDQALLHGVQQWDKKQQAKTDTRSST